MTALHYLTSTHAHHLHDIYRRLYYLPIIVAAFLGGIRGGFVAALVVCLVYAPHAFGPALGLPFFHDPASTTQKLLEMVLYFAVGLVTGVLVSRLERTQHRLETTTEELRGSLDQLRHAEEEVVRSARLAAVGRLSAGLAHEIRNPLASIKGSAEILADDFPREHPKHRLLQVLVDEAVRLNEVLSRFLAFARPRPLERKELALDREIEEVITLLEGQSGTRGVRFVFSRTDAAPCLVTADREQLRQVLLNVLLNAAQAAGSAVEAGAVPAAGGAVADGSAAGGEVRIECRAGNGAVRLRVRDTGPGFSPEALANAFTPFFTTREQGTGLGLAISHRIIESHGGSIRALNAPEGGGVIELELPQRRPDGEDPLR